MHPAPRAPPRAMRGRGARRIRLKARTLAQCMRTRMHAACTRMHAVDRTPVCSPEGPPRDPGHGAGAKHTRSLATPPAKAQCPVPPTPLFELHARPVLQACCAKHPHSRLGEPPNPLYCYSPSPPPEMHPAACSALLCCAPSPPLPLHSTPYSVLYKLIAVAQWLRPRPFSHKELGHFLACNLALRTLQRSGLYTYLNIEPKDRITAGTGSCEKLCKLQGTGTGLQRAAARRLHSDLSDLAMEINPPQQGFKKRRFACSRRLSRHCCGA